MLITKPSWKTFYVLISLALFIFIKPTTAQQQYTITKVTPVTENNSTDQYHYAYGINNSRTVVGRIVYINSTGFDVVAFRWSGDIGSLLGAIPNTQGNIRAAGYAINNSGTTVGEANFGEGQSRYHACFWSNGNLANDIHSGTSHPDTRATAINDNGKIVGALRPAFGITPPDSLAFIWSHDTSLQTLGTLGGGSYAFDINNQGIVVGVSGDNNSTAFIWDSSNGMRYLNTAISTGGLWQLISGIAINDNGQIAGQGNFLTIENVPFFWNGVQIRQIGSFGGSSTEALGLNNNGQVVGYSQDPNGQSKAFVWDEVNGIQDLNNFIQPNSGWVLESATGINDNGQIVGNGTYNGLYRSFVLTPIREVTPVIFVPGIAGSVLKEIGGGTLWPPQCVLCNDLDKLTLNPTLPQTEIEVSDALKREPPPISFLGDIIVYESLIYHLKNQGGYREYDVARNPVKRTLAGCNPSEHSNNPNLFVFAYDWRKSNAENSAALREYVQCVQRFYPNKKVNVVTHSMGSLLARRYILDNPDTHNVNKMITIGAPWLGAPKGIYALETGSFFDNPFDNIRIVDGIFGSTLKQLIEFYPGAHELLPSRWYFNLGGQPLAVQNGTIFQNYTFDQTAFWLNQRHPRSNPSTTAIYFHDNPRQDDWRNDPTGVKYFHIYGEQSRNQTVGQVIERDVTRCYPVGTGIYCFSGKNLQPVRTNGDGTVPLLSARRKGNGINLNYTVNTPTDQRFFLIRSLNENTDNNSDHTEMTKFVPLQRLVVDLLNYEQYPPPNPQLFFEPLSSKEIKKSKQKGNNLDSPSSENEAVIIPDDEQSVLHAPSYYIDIVGSTNVSVSEIGGSSSSSVVQNSSLTSEFYQTVPFGVEIDPTGDNSVQVVTPTNKEYTVTLRSNDEPMQIEIIQGEDNITPTQLIRYLDLNLPANVEAQLIITAQGTENLQYDADGDGIFETIVVPTVSVTGTAAQDMTAPTIQISESGQSLRQITIEASDNETGVKDVWYSLNGTNYQRYTGTFTLNPTNGQMIYAFANDNVGNRSSIATRTLTVINQPPDVSQARPSVTTLWPPNHNMMSVSILGITDPDGDSVSISINQIKQDEATNGTGDGDTCPDAQGINTTTGQLRAERKGNGNGRVYTIYFTATDGRGGSTQGTVKVNVPKNQKSNAVDDGPIYDSTTCSESFISSISGLSLMWNSNDSNLVWALKKLNKVTENCYAIHSNQSFRKG